jgi:hypothetical protein
VIRALLARCRLNVAPVAIGSGDPRGWQPEELSGADVLGVAEIAPIQAPVVPMERHQTETVHAYTHHYGRVAETPAAGSRV